MYYYRGISFNKKRCECFAPYENRDPCKIKSFMRSKYEWILKNAMAGSFFRKIGKIKYGTPASVLAGVPYFFGSF